MSFSDILNKDRITLENLKVLLSCEEGEEIEALAARARRLTQKHFGKTIQLYVPLYLSNECDNQCVYCGFNSKISGKRISLTIEQAYAEARVLAEMGFRHILLVSGEKREIISVDYLEALVSKLRGLFSSISIEIYPLSEDGYRRLYKAGVDGLTVYQEVYNRDIYKKVHPFGPKSDYDFRLEAPERGGRAGFYRINIGCLLGLGDWYGETLALAEHARALQKEFWQAQIAVSFPRINGFAPINPVSDLQLTKMICALRVFLPTVGMVLSTRERADLRDRLIPLGITQMSAASRTSPGAYSSKEEASEQFSVADQRNIREVSAAITSAGYEPVLKDWDSGFIKNIVQ